MSLRVDDHLVGVEYDDERTAAAIRSRCHSWLIDDSPAVPAAFGIRVARTGLLRRRTAVVHHGVPIHYRAPSLDAAISMVAAVLDDLTRRPTPHQVALQGRVFARDGRAVLVDALPSMDIDDRWLAKRGILELALWRAMVDTRTGAVSVGDRTLSLAAMVVARPGTLDDARRHLWAASEGNQGAWAQFLDESADRIHVVATAAAVRTAIAAVLDSTQGTRRRSR